MPRSCGGGRADQHLNNWLIFAIETQKHCGIEYRLTTTCGYFSPNCHIPLSLHVGRPMSTSSVERQFVSYKIPSTEAMEHSNDLKEEFTFSMSHNSDFDIVPQSVKSSTVCTPSWNQASVYEYDAGEPENVAQVWKQDSKYSWGRRRKYSTYFGTAPPIVDHALDTSGKPMQQFPMGTYA